MSNPQKEWQEAQDEYDSHISGCPQQECGQIARCTCGDEAWRDYLKDIDWTEQKEKK